MTINAYDLILFDCFVLRNTTPNTCQPVSLITSAVVSQLPGSSNSIPLAKCATICPYKFLSLTTVMIRIRNSGFPSPSHFPSTV